ncbi:TetR/AcrR family transcriptional regulator [Planococcus sp. CPCC 101016]|uniref:TetR/AcrR family transcriptional regulator n=1 Tax=Planococcus sp. CPCC 101016 TaxID=2599617 RepID=UPI0011B3EADD|nr:TetR-like C-terminal domain-containing protein [Planococcus sp. CPCC 101016]TWT07961.1 TetR/AcrR family transcriptional regulator [Planococcus sp. CPCC 101016]
MSINKKEDPRSIRSKEMFEEAVLSLLAENPAVSALTIQKVAQRAKLNRTTFYLHYQDIHDLLKQITDKIINQLSDKIEALTLTEDLSDQEQLIEFLDFLYQQRKFLNVLFEMRNFERELFVLLKRLMETRRRKKEDALPMEYVSVDIKVASLNGILMWWLKDGIHFSSEYIADQIHLMYRT